MRKSPATSPSAQTGKEKNTTAAEDPQNNTLTD